MVRILFRGVTKGLCIDWGNRVFYYHSTYVNVQLRLLMIFFVIKCSSSALHTLGSLAIVTDAAHLFTDIGNFLTAILASHLALQPASSKHSYGMSYKGLSTDG